jgi:FtsP/CotA-like multicopper oxidase with cupredoxin domain
MRDGLTRPFFLVVPGGTPRAYPRILPPTGLAVPTIYSVAPAAAVHARTLRLSEDATRFYLNGVVYRPALAPIFTAYVGTTEEWTIENVSTEVHAFHLHQVHVVLESVNGRLNRDRHWIDVVDVFPSSQFVRQCGC